MIGRDREYQAPTPVIAESAHQIPGAAPVKIMGRAFTDVSGKTPFDRTHQRGTQKDHQLAAPGQGSAP